MTIEATALTRAFTYNGAKLLDPGAALTPDQVRDFYTNVYPDLANAEVEGPEEKDGVQQYTFRRAVGTKGGTKNNPGAYDCYANAAPDEPLFILLGRDPLAGALVRLWATLREFMPENPQKIADATAVAEAMDAWCRSVGKKPLMNVPELIWTGEDEDVGRTPQEVLETWLGVAESVDVPETLTLEPWVRVCDALTFDVRNRDGQYQLEPRV